MSTHLRWRRIQDFLIGGSATYGALWMALESISAFFGSLKPGGLVGYSVLLAVATVGGILRARTKKQIEFQIPASDSSFEIRFGNICDGKAVVVVPVNDYFDGELGDHVSEHSLHGKFIRDVLGGQSKTFVDLTSKSLVDVAPEEADVKRSSGRCDRYGIGTVARVDVNRRRYLLVALSHTDPLSLKGHASVHDLWTCLAGVWKGIREYSNGKPVTIPLIGSGLSGVGLPPQHLIEIVITSFLCHTKERKVADGVTLMLPRRLAGHVDLKSIERRWA